MLVHTDQKPFVCQHCDQSFRQKQLLKRHVNLYHNPNYAPPQPKEKTHECPECGRAFRHKGNLIRHLAIHDPDASAAEKQLALKLGRETKVSVSGALDGGAAVAVRFFKVFVVLNSGDISIARQF
ncbi:MAG: C2H2-type zinc finger protein, partial [Pseudomonadota bacterium]